MPQTCVAYKCLYRSKKGDGIKLHTFPKDENVKKEWEKVCRYWNPCQDDRVCSQHFLQSDYTSPTSNTLDHSRGVVPSKFKYLLDSAQRKRPPPKDRSFDSSTSSSSSETSFTLPLDEEPNFKKPKLMSPSKEELKKKISEQKRKIKTLNQKIRRQRSKIKTIEEMYKELVQRNLLHENFAEQLKRQFPGMSYEVISNHFANKDKKPQGHRHSDEAKKFALTLNFYSPKAYEYVRTIFSLPHPRSLSEWTSSVDCEPGLFNDVFDHLQNLVHTDSRNADATLIADEMSIQQLREWKKKLGKIEGFTDYGPDIIVDDPDEIATNALVLMLVGMRKHWKYPVGYVLTNKITSENLNCLLRKTLDESIAHKLKVRVITMDGTTTNLSAMKLFGCQIDGKTGVMDGSFKYPGCDHTIYFHPDPPHMLKLARNALDAY